MSEIRAAGGCERGRLTQACGFRWPLASSRRRSAEKPPQPSDVVGHVGQRDCHPGPGQSYCSDGRPLAIPLMPEDVLDLGVHDRLAPVRPGGACRHCPPAGLLAVDLALHPVGLQPSLVLSRPICGIRPDPAPGIRSLDQAFPQAGAVMLGCIRDDLPPDDAILAVDGDVTLAAEDRDGDVDRLGTIGAGLGLGMLDRPARIRVFLRRLRGFAGPDLLCGPARLDGRLLAVRIALARGGD